MEKDWKYSDNRISAKVLPESWLYPQNGLQLIVTLIQTGECHFLVAQDISFAKATKKAVKKLLDQIVFTTCSCGNPRFDKAAMLYWGNDMCGVCFRNAVSEGMKLYQKMPSHIPEAQANAPEAYINEALLPINKLLEEE